MLVVLVSELIVLGTNWNLFSEISYFQGYYGAAVFFKN